MLFAVCLIAILGASVLSAQRVPIQSAWMSQTEQEASIPASTARVVSLISASDEMLIDMGLEERVIALSLFADDERISNVLHRGQDVPNRVRADAEQILVLQPDLVIASAFNRPETLALLAYADIPIARLMPPSTLQDIRTSIRQVGDLMGNESRAETLVQRLDATLASAADLAAGHNAPRVLFYSASGYTAGTGTLFDELLGIAGGRNVASELSLTGHTPISMEQILSADPDVIFTLHYEADAEARDMLDLQPSSLHVSAWEKLRAVANSKVYALDPRHYLSTTHYVADAALSMARHLHAEQERDD